MICIAVVDNVSYWYASMKRVFNARPLNFALSFDGFGYLEFLPGCHSTRTRDITFL